MFCPAQASPLALAIHSHDPGETDPAPSLRSPCVVPLRKALCAICCSRKPLSGSGCHSEFTHTPGSARSHATRCGTLSSTNSTLATVSRILRQRVHARALTASRPPSPAGSETVLPACNPYLTLWLTAIPSPPESFPSSAPRDDRSRTISSERVYR